jgi:hypothetical protein
MQQAKNVDRRLSDAWSEHPNRQMVSNEFMTTFDQKKAVLVALISQYMNISGYQLQRKNTLKVNEIELYLRRKAQDEDIEEK